MEFSSTKSTAVLSLDPLWPGPPRHVSPPCHVSCGAARPLFVSLAPPAPAVPPRRGRAAGRGFSCPSIVGPGVASGEGDVVTPPCAGRYRNVGRAVRPEMCNPPAERWGYTSGTEAHGHRLEVHHGRLRDRSDERRMARRDPPAAHEGDRRRQATARRPGPRVSASAMGRQEPQRGAVVFGVRSVAGQLAPVRPGARRAGAALRAGVSLPLSCGRPGGCSSSPAGLDRFAGGRA